MASKAQRGCLVVGSAAELTTFDATLGSTGAMLSKRRGLNFESVIDSTMGMWGDLQSIAGKALPEIATLEAAIIKLLRVRLPDEIFVATSPFGSGRDAIPELHKQNDIRYDWVIRKRRYVSFFDPSKYGTRAIVDLDQVEAIETNLFALN